jgi:ABC-2 type transport system permease protein
MNSFVWLVRRELWESRTVWVAPAICAAIMIGGLFLASLGHNSMSVDGDGVELSEFSAQMSPAKIEAILSIALGVIAVPFFITILFTQFFYTLDALYAERRDRSILFWKSLPVSDTEVVLAKLCVAGVVIPLVAAAAAIVTQIVVVAIASVKLSSLTMLAGHFWNPATWGGSLIVIVYVLIASMLWYLPLLGWLLLVSAWAPRSPFMWAAMPPLAVGLAEYVVFRSHHVLQLVGERVGNTGLIARAFSDQKNGYGFGIVIHKDSMRLPRALTELMQPAEFFSSPAVWLGVAVGAALIAGAIWMRRYRDASS